MPASTNVVTVPASEVGSPWIDSPIRTVTVKLFVVFALKPPTVTVIGPVIAPTGTVVTIWVGVEMVSMAGVPLKTTVLSDGVVLKFVPVMITVEPIGPLWRLSGKNRYLSTR